MTPHFDIFNRKATDQKTVAERKWQARLMAKREQQPCDVGLFSDESKQMALQDRKDLG